MFLRRHLIACLAVALCCACSDDDAPKPDQALADGPASDGGGEVTLPATATMISHSLTVVNPKELMAIQKVFLDPAVAQGRFEMGLHVTQLDTTTPALEVGSVTSVDPPARTEARWIPNEDPWVYRTQMTCSREGATITCDEPTDASFVLQYRTNLEPPMHMPLLMHNFTLTATFTNNAESMTCSFSGIIPNEVASQVLLDMNGDDKLDPADDLPLTSVLGQPNEDSDGDGTMDDYRFTLDCTAKPTTLLTGAADAGPRDDAGVDAAPDVGVDTGS